MSERQPKSEAETFQAMSELSEVLEENLETGTYPAEDQSLIKSPCPFKAREGSKCWHECANFLPVTSVNLAETLMIKESELGQTYKVESIGKAARKRMDQLRSEGKVDVTQCSPFERQN